jgi:hypothetical protein
MICFLNYYNFWIIYNTFNVSVSKIIRQYFKVEHILSTFFFFGKKSRFMYLMNFLLYFDKYGVRFFNFFILYNKLSLINRLLVKNKKVSFLTGFFIPINRFFRLSEMFLKNQPFNLFSMDFFYFLNLKLHEYKYLISFNNFYFRLSTISFFILYKYAESVRRIKYNEYLLGSYLFSIYIKARRCFFKRYWHLRVHECFNSGLFLGVGLASTYLMFFAYAIKHLRILIFSFKSLSNFWCFELGKNIINVYKDSKFLNLFIKIINFNFLNQLMSFYFSSFSTFYVILDSYTSFQKDPKSFHAHRRKIFYGYEEISYNVRDVFDLPLVYAFISKKALTNLVKRVFKNNNIIEFYFVYDLIYNFKFVGKFFWNCLFNVIFWDYHEKFYDFWAERKGEFLRPLATNGYFERLFSETFFYSFSIDILKYSKWFFQFEYFYWRIIHSDHCLRLPFKYYITTPVYDFIYLNRYAISLYMVQRLYYLENRKRGDKSIIYFYYMFLLHRDIMVKTIILSFDFSLIFFFLFSKSYYVDRSKLPHLLKINAIKRYGFLC